MGVEIVIPLEESQMQGTNSHPIYWSYM